MNYESTDQQPNAQLPTSHSHPGSKNVLLIGGTGGISLWLCHYLLKTNHRVTVLIRSYKKFVDLFSKKYADDWQKSDKIKIEVLDLEKTTTEAIESPNDVNPYEKYFAGQDICIQSVGCSQVKKRKDGHNDQWRHTEIMNWHTNRLLIDAAVATALPKFILTSTMYITRPYSFPAFFVNTIAGGSLKYKLQAENYLRQSGLNYVIVRPGRLTGEKSFSEKQHSLHPDALANLRKEIPAIYQGDTVRSRKMTRNTCGRFIVDYIVPENKDLPNKFTCDVIAD